MNYQQTINFLYNHLPQYQKEGKKAYTGKLENIKRLCTYLNNPEKKIRCIHIAGTNGKGSSSHLLASYLISKGHKTGLYTSPHLYSFRERIQVNGQLIAKDDVVSFVQLMQDKIVQHAFSFFEITVAMAFCYFEKQKVSYAVIETGLGGEYDSTNIICPVLTLITNIGYDHQAILGTSLEEIAKAKAGIIKKKVPVVVSEYQPSLFPIFKKKANDNSAPIFIAEKFIRITSPFPETKNLNTLSITCMPFMEGNKAITFLIDFPLVGKHQQDNLRGVLVCLLLLGFSINKSSLAKTFDVMNTQLPLVGRYQTLAKNPRIVCDVSHNVQGITCLMNLVRQEHIARLFCIIGFSKDKNIVDFLPLLPKHAIYALCDSQNARTLPPKKLAQEMRIHFNVQWVGGTVNQNITRIAKHMKKHDLLLIFGSFFVVSEIDNQLKNLVDRC